MNITLDETQKQAVYSNSHFLVVRACPGSGKTTVLAERIKRLIHEGEHPGRICAVTYTNAAAKEIEKRIGAKIGFIGTLHGLLLSNAIYQRAVLSQEQTEKLRMDSAVAIGFKGCNKSINRIFRKALRREPLEDKERLVFQHYRTTLSALGATDFDMILLEGPDRAGALSFHHLLVDEVQDAAAIDLDIYLRMSVPNRFFVGDSDQCIFSFRGADPMVMTELEREADQVVYLQNTYRCGRAVATLANALIRRNVGAHIEMEPAHPYGGIATTEGDKASVVDDLDDWLQTKNPDETAVLVRTNREVMSVADDLHDYGWWTRVRIKTNDDSLDLLQAYLAFLTWPECNALCLHLIAKVKGQAVADQTWKDYVMSDHESLNQATWKAKPVTSVNEVIENWLVGHPGFEPFKPYVQRKFAELPEGAGMKELILELERDRGFEEQSVSAVLVTTMHSAKGREFRNVAILLESQRPVSEKTEEEVRLLYVAYTRAKDNLFIGGEKIRELTTRAREVA